MLNSYPYQELLMLIRMRHSFFWMAFFFLFLPAVLLASSMHPSRLYVLENLQAPESAAYDADQDVYFVSNIDGDGTARDNNGFISRVRVDGKIEDLKFIQGGSKDVELNAPKGLTVSGNLLWVADIDTVRAFDKRTGAAKKNVELSSLGAIFLNDLTAGPDGSILVTDTGLRFDEAGNSSHTGPDRVFLIPSDGPPRVAIEGPFLAGPNGILWDEKSQSFITVPLEGKQIVSWRIDDSSATTIASGAGGFDGIARLDDSQLIVSSLDTSTIYLLENGSFTPIITGIETPADICLDPKRNRLLIPSFSTNHLEIWQL